jgi:hypothetical protein
MEYTNVYFDTEFTGLKKDTELISIGCVSESGASFYAEFNDFNIEHVDDWIQENVINHLVLRNHDLQKNTSDVLIRDLLDETGDRYNVQMLANTQAIARELIAWLVSVHMASNGRQIRFISDCYAYDWMLLCDMCCIDKCAINPIPYTSYIPIDLSTALLFVGVDPDINREEFIGDVACKDITKSILELKAFNQVGFKSIKHNSLWDAYVIKHAFNTAYNIHKISLY